MRTQDDESHTLFKWEGPLDARKIVERTIAGILSSIVAGFFMGIGFLVAQGVFG